MTKEQLQQYRKDKLNRVIVGLKHNNNFPRDIEVEDMILDFVYANQELGNTNTDGLINYASNNGITPDELKLAIKELTMLKDIELYRNKYWVLTEQSMRKYKIMDQILGRKKTTEALT